MPVGDRFPAAFAQSEACARRRTTAS